MGETTGSVFVGGGVVGVGVRVLVGSMVAVQVGGKTATIVPVDWIGTGELLICRGGKGLKGKLGFI